MSVREDKLVKIYTKTGDKGETGLVSGTRVSKSDQRIDLYGEVDELNSLIGYLDVETKKELHADVQSQLFNLGSLLACEMAKREEFKLPKVSLDIVKSLEESIDEMTKELPALKNFILPGGTEASARAHLCRVVTRRVERKLVAFEANYKGEAPENSVAFLNRLSDYFFVLARYWNFKNNITETLWKP